MKKKRLLAICLAASLVLPALSINALAENEKEVDVVSYFEIEGAAAELKDDSLDFTLTGETATIQFKNPLAASGFSMKWNGVEDEEKKLEALEIVLTDSENEECSVKVTFGKLNEESTSVKLNEESRSYLSSGSTYRKNESDICLMFNESTNTFTNDLGEFAIRTEKCLNGASFHGFESMGANLTLTMKGEAGAVFSLKSMNEQPIGADYTMDNVDPVLCVPTGQVKRQYNSVSTLPKAAAFDVFSEETTLKVTVQDPQGNVVTDENGTQLEAVDGNQEYKIKFTEYGQYRVIYVASDGVNETRGMGYQIQVQDTGAPEVALAGEMESTVAVGTEVMFPELTITDNLEGECSTWINVLHPEGYMTCEKTSFIPKTEGKYVITFCAQDESGNIGRFVTSIYAEGSSE